MAKSMFKRGFKAVDEEKKRQEERREQMKKGLWRFFLAKDGDEADISFLTEDPINFYEHNVKSYRNGKEFFDSVPCTGEDCERCADNDRPSFKSGWLIVDHRPYEYTDKDGKKKKGKDQLRLFVYGTKVAGQLDRKAKKYGLVGKMYTMVRIGKGTDTTYTFENGDDFEYSEKEIEQLLPEALRKDYDGTMDSLYSIIEDQISMLVSGDDTTSNTKEDDEEDNVKDSLVSTDDDEEEEEVKPTRSAPAKSSVKSLLKGRNKR